MPNVLIPVELLLIAAVIAIATRHIRLPYTIALVAGGLVISLVAPLQQVPPSRDLILFVLLPPLLFEGSVNMDLGHLHEQGWLAASGRQAQRLGGRFPPEAHFRRDTGGKPARHRCRPDRNPKPGCLKSGRPKLGALN